MRAPHHLSVIKSISSKSLLKKIAIYTNLLVFCITKVLLETAYSGLSDCEARPIIVPAQRVLEANALVSSLCYRMVCVCYSKMTYESWHLTSPYVEIALIGLVVMVLRLCGRERFVRISARLIAFPRPTISTLAWLDLTEAHSHWRFKNAAQITNTELTTTPHLNPAGRDPAGSGRKYHSAYSPCCELYICVEQWRCVTITEAHLQDSLQPI